MINLKEFGRDINGNSIVKFSMLTLKAKENSVYINNRSINTDKDSYSYTLQTNGNLPYTHDVKISGLKVKDLTIEQTNKIIFEIENFLTKYGCDKQQYLVSLK